MQVNPSGTIRHKGSRRMIDKLGVVDEFFQRGLWLTQEGGGRRVTGASLKLSPTGYLLIVRAYGAEGPVVAFVGARTLAEVMRKTKSGLEEGNLKWREDQFAFDNSRKV